MKISSIVMASGFSRRAGNNKLLCKLGQKKVIEHVFYTIKRCNFYENIVVTQFAEIFKIAIRYGFKVVNNPQPQKGQSMSLKLGVRETADTQAYALFLGDQPFISYQTLQKAKNKLIENPSCIVATKNENKIGPPVFIPALFREQLLAVSGDKGARGVLTQNTGRILTINCHNPMEMFDLDDQSDMSIAHNYIIKKGG